MLDDALRAEIKDTLTGYLSKGTSAILSGVGGTGIKMVLNLLVTGTTDPTAAMLEKIYDQLTEIKDQIKNLPHVTSVYITYDHAIDEAQLYVQNISGLLSFTEEREELFGTYQNYLSSLAHEQWLTLAKFLTIEPNGSYYSLINSILKSAYGINILNITQAGADKVITFGENGQSYARVISETQLENLPANFYEYVNAQITIRNSVFTAIGGVISCAQLILKTFQDVAAGQTTDGVLKSDGFSLDSNSKNKIIATLNNPEVKLNFGVTEQKPLPNIITKLLIPILNAPQYLCGNAYTVFNAMVINKQKVQLKNIATKKYLVLEGPQGIDLPNRIKGICDYWTTVQSAIAVGWSVEFTSVKESIATITGPNDGYLYMHNPEPMFANKIYTSPSKTNFGERQMGARSHHWKIQLVPAAKVKSGPGAFFFTIVNVKEDKGLVNRIFMIGSDEIGSFKLDKYDGNHQWELIPA